ncbi:DUF3304 domain-containing protein [Enterobacter ludwigii]|uniref:DUF3304 domain-containing protein n=1 Tax=Enterobacter ludwigii TaxID=299767 RepID=UPI003F7310DC
MLKINTWRPCVMFSDVIKSTLVLFFVFSVSGCAKGSNDYNAGDLSGINHTQQGINYFTVNGYRAGLTGNSCCIMLPRKWTPGLKAHVEWEVDPNTAPPFPGYKDRNKFNAWKKQTEASFQKHSAIVDIPKYTETCGMTVHFLPCNQVKVTTSCVGYGTPDYPIKEPLDMKEPAQCPK